MKPTLKSALMLLLIGCVVLCCAQQNTSNEEWIQLFNGRDLNDWDIKIKGHELNDNYKNTFRVEDGLLKVRYDNYHEFNQKLGHIFHRSSWSHYKLRVEYRFVGEQIKGGKTGQFMNNGVMIHGQTAESMELYQDFPVSIEVQLWGDTIEGKWSTGNLCTPGTNVEMNGKLVEDHCIWSGSKTYMSSQWVRLEVEVHGGEIIRHFVNGKEVMHYEKPQLDPRSPHYDKLLPAHGNKILTRGTISLQSESHPTDFRTIELLNLEEEWNGEGERRK